MAITSYLTPRAAIASAIKNAKHNWPSRDELAMHASYCHS